VRAESFSYYTYSSVVGDISIVSNGSAIVSVKINRQNELDYVENPDALTQLAVMQLSEYFNGNRQRFDIPLEPKGTAFQRQVWGALIDIPYGETRSYKQIARAINNPDACRAVGLANNKNPIWIIFPCHRVIGSDGTLTGYGGGLDMKQMLLDLEKGTKLTV